MSTQATAAGDFLQSTEASAALSRYRHLDADDMAIIVRLIEGARQTPLSRSEREKLKGQINHWISTADAFRGSYV